MESCQGSEERNGSGGSGDESGAGGTQAPGRDREEQRAPAQPQHHGLDIPCNMSGASGHNHKRSSICIRKLWKPQEVIINRHSRELRAWQVVFHKRDVPALQGKARSCPWVLSVRPFLSGRKGLCCRKTQWQCLDVCPALPQPLCETMGKASPCHTISHPT